MKYNDIRDELKTGDIVLFSGKGFFSNVIKMFSGSKWSHIGMVVKSEELDMVLLWESTTLSTIADINDGKKKRGVQTVALSERIDTYDGDVAIRQLNGDLDAEALAKLSALRKKLRNRPYEESHLELANSLIDLGPIGENKEEDLSSCFCSEIVAEALQEMGVMDERLPSNEYIPSNFGRGGRAEHYLTPSFSYGDEISVK